MPYGSPFSACSFHPLALLGWLLKVLGGQNKPKLVWVLRSGSEDLKYLLRIRNSSLISLQRRSACQKQNLWAGRVGFILTTFADFWHILLCGTSLILPAVWSFHGSIGGSQKDRNIFFREIINNHLFQYSELFSRVWLKIFKHPKNWLTNTKEWLILWVQKGTPESFLTHNPSKPLWLNGHSN